MKHPKLAMFSRILSLLIVLSMLLTYGVSAAEPQEESPSSPVNILSLLDYPDALADVEYLSKTIGTRPAGTKSESIAQDYVAAEFEELGYEVTRQDVSLGNRTAGDIYLDDLVFAAATPSNNSYYTGFGTASGTAVYLSDPADVEALGDDLRGKVVFFPGNWRSGKDPDTISAISALDSANAEGIVVMLDLSVYSGEATQMLLPTLNFSSHKLNISTPVLLTNIMDAERIPAYLAENPDAEVTLESRTTLTAQNVIGTKKAATDSELTIYISAHIDTVNPSPGANDNGSGMAGLLTLARAFKNVDTNYNIVFTSLCAEEIGLLGSKHFANSLSAEERANAIGNYNMDTMASSQENCSYMAMMSASRRTVNGVTSSDNHSTRMAQNIARSMGIDDQHFRVIYGTNADHNSFHSVGIPSAEFYWGRSTTSLAIESAYHTMNDNLENNFSILKFGQILEVIAQSVYTDATSNYVAVVGEGAFREYYTSLSDAITAAGDTEALKILKPVTLENNSDIVKLLDYDAALEDVAYLSKTIGTRPAGSQSEKLALDYVAAECEELGYEITRQEVPLSSNCVGDIYLGDQVFAAGTPSKNSYYTGFGTATGTAVYLADPADVATLGDDLTGKVVFFPGNWRSGKDPDTISAISALDTANAEGIVVMMDPTIYTAERTQKTLPTLNFQSHKLNISTPVLLTNIMDGERIPAYLAEHPNAEVTLDSRTSGTSGNVIALKKAAVETDLTIYVSAHIDSVLPSPGANDNGSGVAGILAIARAFEHIETNYNIVFTFFGAEEIFWVGSIYYTESLTSEEIANAIGNYNLDMLATSQENCDYIYMDSCAAKVAINSPELDLHVSRQARNAARSLGYDMDRYLIEYDIYSDHYSFYKIGVPSVEFIWLNGASSPQVESYYHTSYDTMEMNFSIEKLQKQVDAITLAVCNDATADYVAVVGEGIYREYYTSLEEAQEAAGEDGVLILLKPVEDETLKLGHTLNLASDISVNFALSKAALEGYDMTTVYMESTLEICKEDGTVSTVTYTLMPTESGDYYYFTLTGLTAVQIGDRISTTFYGTKDGVIYCSATDDYSIADYAYSQMNKANMPDALKTLCADLLRYGGAAQIFKSYRTDNLADSAMTEEQKAFLSDIEAVTFGNTNTVLNDLEGATVTWGGKSLDLASKVTLKFMFDPTNYEGDPETLSIRIAFLNRKGEEQTVILENPELYNAERGLYAVSFDGLLASELRAVVSAQVYAGDVPVSCTLQYSADTYGNNKPGSLGELCKALFAYSDSAKAFFGAIS